ncbi:penicillin acylase family protein [Sphingomonas cannabina]|uniref:penicillin acylase family protein n=1 Tax=Sphingomonas cannabina TaxID=2899123 RepID=UPI001F429979|nr:penicillin acylase family protein [Sphingomonas cannabina]UIJ47292.1 penicillin acylase family protein [Sphingomonas cannabina]
MIQRRAFLLASAAILTLESTGLARPIGKANIGPGRKLRIAGARAPIEILEDRMGIPHIRAKSKHDAFFGQGYMVARDRLFQIDFAYRRELGRMAEVFGPRFVAADRAARLFQYHGDIDAELRALPAEVLECARGYVAGVNARIAELEADPTLLPLEYRILGITPLHWDVRDLVRVRSDGMGNVDDEVRRAQLQARGLLHLDQFMDPLRPAWQFTVPEGLDCAAVSEADLGVLLDAARPLPFDDGQLAFSSYDRELDRIDLAGQGSNAWTVAGSRTATGRPILANDPHLGIGGASPRHISHLTAPGLDVIGGGQPGLPGIMQGHTDRFAFGRTNFHIDQTDLFILRTRDDDPQQYWHDGKWKRFETVEEEIAVKGAPPQRVVLRYAEGRPIVSEDPARHRAVAFASVSLLSGANMRFAMIAINLARDWASLREAFKIHVSPTNIHYADVDGNTGWHTVGFVPKRPRHDGLFPAPGDGSYDWTGILKVEEMPNIYNPKQGWFASANEMNLPADYPYKERKISFSWSDPFRHDRVAEVLSAQPRHRIEDSIALQHDVQSLPARALMKLLPAKPSPAAAPAAQLLRRWNCAIEADSAAALLYELVMPELSSGFRELVIPPAARDLIPSVNLSEMLRLLAAPDKRLGADPVAARDALVDKALAAGWAKAVELRGPDPAGWRWGDLHQVVIAHPLSKLPAIAAAFPRIDGGRSGGDGTTVMARGVNPARGYNVTHGASYLLVADVGAWDNSRVLLLPGQSADPRSPHYRDFYPDWLAGNMQPLWFSKTAVDANAVSRTVLAPAD